MSLASVYQFTVWRIICPVQTLRDTHMKDVLLLQLKNNSPFQASATVVPDVNGVDTMVLTVKGTFTLDSQPEIAEQQEPIHIGDVFHEDLASSSLKYAGEFHLSKPGTDIVLLGHAQTPDRRSVTQIDTLLRVGPYQKTLRVFGDRQWHSGITGFKMSPPEPFETMPLVYERAYGGVVADSKDPSKNRVEERNPVGRGFAGGRRAEEMEGQLLPNLEDPNQLISSPGSKPTPACYGYVAATWLPRRNYVGTYDETWRRTRAPYLPTDFNPQFFHSAHPDLITATHLSGGEPVELVNLVPGRSLKFHLPQVALSATLPSRDEVHEVPFQLETLLFEPDELRFSMIWRGLQACDKHPLQIEEMLISANLAHDPAQAQG